MIKRQRRFMLVAITALTAGAITGRLALGPLFGPQTSQEATQHTTAKTSPAPNALACIAALPDDTLVAQKLMFAGYSDQIEASAIAIGGTNIGGVIIMDQSSAEIIDALTSAFSTKPLIAVDQEGGTVQRYTENGILPGAESMASNSTPEQAYQSYLNDAKHLKSIGITTNFAPVVDVASHTPNPLPGRMYASDPSIVSSYASQAIKASQAAGVTPVIKHFPGLGSASDNTDFESASTDPLSTLTTRDLVPYRTLAALKPDVMISNAIVPELSDGLPAVWSAATINLLRSYGYGNSVVYSDSLTAAAIPDPLDVAVVKSWQAGVDVALIVQSRDQTTKIPEYIQSINARVKAAFEKGELSRSNFVKSVDRIFARKAVNACNEEP